MNPYHDNVRHPRHHAAKAAGFSAIELVIVMGVMASLVALSAGQVLPALRRSSVNDAAALIANANQRARVLSMRGGDKVYGVRVIDTDVARVQIMERDAGTTDPDLFTVATSGDGLPALYDREIDDAAIIWLGNEDLRSTTDQNVIWFYDQAGRLLHQDGTVSNVGIIGPDILAAGVPWVNGTIDSRISPIAPNLSDGTAGLSIRTAGGDYGLRISIGSLGTYFDEEL